MSKLEKMSLARTISEAIEEQAAILAMLIIHEGHESKKRQVAYEIMSLFEARKGVLRDNE